MLNGMGFKEVINMTGGIKAWDSNTAIGPEDLGLTLFSGKESPEDTLVAAYSMEKGLMEFYLSMVPKVTNDDTRKVFEKLATIEVKHQERLLAEYHRISGSAESRDDFEERLVAPAMEGGLTTEEYIDRYRPDLNVVVEVVSLAMAIEAQALDLYQRAADRSDTEASQSVLIDIANEERAHLKQLAALLDA